MKFNFIGVAQALVALEGTEKTWTQVIYEDGVKLSLAGLVFTLVLVSPQGEVQENTLEVADDAVMWHLPALAAGAWSYELWVADATGKRERMFYGALEVLAVAMLQPSTSAAQAPVMKTFLGSEDGSVRWDWLAVNAAQFYAQEAAGSADDAQTAKDEVLDAVQAVPELREFIEHFRTEVSTAIFIDADGFWNVGTMRTSTRAQGPRGMNADEVQYHTITSATQLPTDEEHCSPYHRYVIQRNATASQFGLGCDADYPPADRIISFGEHEVLAPEFEQWTSNEAWRDAINASTAKDYIVFVDSSNLGNSVIAYFETIQKGAASEVFAPLSHYFPVVSYSRGVDAIATVYVWASNSWRAFPLNSPLIATTQAHGLALLATDDVIENGLPVGNDAQGHLVTDASALPLPDATTSVKGVMKRAAAIAEGDDGAASGAQVADALDGKQDVLDFADPDSPVMQAIAQAVQEAVAAAGVGAAVGDVKINFSPEAPAGYLPMEGQRGISRTTYAALFAYFAAHGVVLGDGTPIADSGDGATTFDMPDISGCFMRFIGSGRQLDAGRVPGSFQESAAPNITGTLTELDRDYGLWQATGVFSVSDATKSSARGGGGGSPRNVRVDFDAARASNVYRNDVTEARPANIGLYAYIKY